MTCPNCEQMLRMLEALSGPEPAELVRVRTESALVFCEGEAEGFSIDTEQAPK